jgi:hypothetical protein
LKRYRHHIDRDIGLRGSTASVNSLREDQPAPSHFLCAARSVVLSNPSVE